MLANPLWRGLRERAEKSPGDKKHVKGFFHRVLPLCGSIQHTNTMAVSELIKECVDCRQLFGSFQAANCKGPPGLPRAVTLYGTWPPWVPSNPSSIATIQWTRACLVLSRAQNQYIHAGYPSWPALRNSSSTSAVEALPTNCQGRL